MTTVHIGACAVELKGHADAPRNEQDHDLVCAAISALTCTLAEVVRRAYVAGALLCEPQIKISPGNVCICCAPMAAFTFFRCGMEILAESYPGHIQIS